MFEDVFFGGDSFYVLMKIAFLISSAFYIIFAFVIVRQVNKMTHTLEVGFETPIRFLSWVHLLLSVCVFLFALVIL